MSEEDPNDIAARLRLHALPPSLTTQEVYDAIVAAAPAMDAAWQSALNNDAVWCERAKHYGWLRTWWLRWQLRRGK